jgi:hypothetical protein
MPRCTTNSIRSAISLRGKSTSRDALHPWLSGALSWHRSPLARWRSRCMSMSLHYLDTAARRPSSEANSQACGPLSAPVRRPAMSAARIAASFRVSKPEAFAPRAPTGRFDTSPAVANQRRHVRRPSDARIQSGDGRGARPGFASADRVDRELQVTHCTGPDVEGGPMRGYEDKDSVRPS